GHRRVALEAGVVTLAEARAETRDDAVGVADRDGRRGAAERDIALRAFDLALGAGAFAGAGALRSAAEAAETGALTAALDRAAAAADLEVTGAVRDTRARRRRAAEIDRRDVGSIECTLHGAATVER